MKYQQDSHNANRGTDRGRALVEKSLRDLGAGRSIVVDKNGIAIAGNKTLEAAERLGLPVREVETDGSELVVVKRSDLDLSEPVGKARKLAYADNRAGELGLEWDAEVIRADLGMGLDLGGLGFGGWSDAQDAGPSTSGGVVRVVVTVPPRVWLSQRAEIDAVLSSLSEFGCIIEEKS